MKTIQVDLAVIGGGPAGLAAAAEAKRQGIQRVVLIERDLELGGILQQCVHDGFGLHRFQRRMSGGQYAEAFIRDVQALDIQVQDNTMVLEITPDKKIYAVNEKEGMLLYECGAIILAMGCRERTRNQVFIYGSRTSGILTAGAVQRYINMEGYLPGRKAVILGSGDIGLIMARRMTLEGMEVEGVYEVMPSPGGLTRNIVQCLEDYNIPLHLSTTVVKTHGRERLTGVTVAKVDENRRPIPGTERYIDCDLLVLAVGLIPENELSRGAGIEIDPRTQGPVVDQDFMTSIDGVFAAGNVVAVFDLVDYVSETGEIAARGAARYLKKQREGSAETPVYHQVRAGEGVNFVIPQKVAAGEAQQDMAFYLRVKQPDQNMVLSCRMGEETVSSKKERFVAPPEMLVARVKSGCPLTQELTVEVRKEKRDGQ
ncbi:NAD(P)/FAD-dependent oxidoreductase [Pseudoflavonifractor phocaeensis]|uniref:NAD(P)/FAD-dependent oxidoreductase n=1 Tax=Oscillospiraceae TaxID=216572 RepID=UPI001749650D|nr:MULTISPECIES: FAD-dependent oxidoreductase [Oscillospiraceae]MBM6721682.1 FAD-dependent oxidoreductase [Pseudoflavonifractor phocaeensis]